MTVTTTFHNPYLFGAIQYTALVGTTLVGYYLNPAQDRALVHVIAGGQTRPLGECPVSFPHRVSVAEYVERVTA